MKTVYRIDTHIVSKHQTCCIPYDSAW